MAVCGQSYSQIRVAGVILAMMHLVSSATLLREFRFTAKGLDSTESNALYNLEYGKQHTPTQAKYQILCVCKSSSVSTPGRAAVEFTQSPLSRSVNSLRSTLLVSMMSRCKSELLTIYRAYGKDSTQDPDHAQRASVWLNPRHPACVAPLSAHCCHLRNIP